jgi:hypothetical protein
LNDIYKEALKKKKNTNYPKYEWIREDPLVKLNEDNDDG